MKASLTSPVSKPSRQGEVQLRSDLVSSQVQLWFKQLRRLQSYKHAAVANKQTLDAEVYRLSLWAAIKKGRGFDGFFNECAYGGDFAPLQLRRFSIGTS